jgi:hypothetical protein
MKRFYIVATLVICLMAQKPVSVSANTAHCGNITANEVWGNTGNVHMVTCDVDINSGVTLIIYENTMIKFENGHKLIVNGTLHVSGNSSQPIYFTSIRDDTVGGDTNADGGASTPNWDNWRGIEFRDSRDDAASLIDHVIIRFAGGDYRGSVNLDNASPTLSHSTFPHSYHVLIVTTVFTLTHLPLFWYATTSKIT